jgi:hypothetical protein
MLVGRLQQARPERARTFRPESIIVLAKSSIPAGRSSCPS